MPDRSSRRSDLDRLAAAVLQVGFDGTTPPDWVLRELAGGLGGVVLFARNIDGDPADVVRRLREENPEVIVAADEEGGTVTRLEAARGSSWPGNAALGMLDDVARTERTAAEIGRLLAATGVTLDYAPDVDVNADPANPVIGVRSFGADPGLVARHAAAWVTGLQAQGVAACAKHFPGHGDTVTDSHLALPTLHASRELLERRDLPPFRAAVAAGVRAIMCGHLLVPALDPDLTATLSRRVMTDLLREELGFQGLLVTDAIEMKAVSARMSQPEVAVRALAAGADAICVGISSPGGENVAAMREAIAGAVRDGTLPESRLAEAADRVAALVAWTGGGPAGGPGVPLDPEYGVSRLGLESARLALRAVPGEGAVARPVLTRAPVVIEMTARPHQAIGDAPPYGPAEALAARLPGTTRVTLTPDHHAVPPLGGHGDAPPVLVTRDAHRHAWMRRVLAEVLRRRPDAVVIEMGLPGRPCGAVHLATGGDSRVSAIAAAEWLTSG
ncbi:hydrolase [Sphaerisporangium siamense]|uniref:Beta-N-acetylhexosaminidase n=1 Tax=Sphaerisporangium siamense TaxID=795645 RepID=A0A7W7GB95_9ACTN|nr:glycoside hydrolase family 3 N-terminal domain-containing protein [Sphaerisporangium siamense]MBB4703237.1 beta-N-acetylhexosaminidase [Sphaerisporangium siamense]GII88014.1 hydrolase [Sphaerisporangium siamense]